jgi:hypothetical protein
MKDQFPRMATSTDSHHEDFMKSYSLWLGVILIVFGASATSVEAQAITNAEIERGLRFRGTPSYDGETYTQRYSYGLGAAPFYLNGDSRQLYYLDYLDRADRAEKFGYRMPVDPYFEAPPPVPTYTPVRGYIGIGAGYGIWRRR